MGGLFVFIMVLIEQAFKYVIVKAGKVNTRLYGTVYQANGVNKLDSLLKTVDLGTSLGTIVQTYRMPDNNHLARILLLEPITIGFKQYSHAIVLLNDVDGVAAPSTPISANKMYYCLGNNVNIRSKASKTSTKLKQQLQRGDRIGTSTGIVTNNFLKFDLAIGGIGFVSLDYCTTQEPSSVKTADGSTVISDVQSTINIAKTAATAIISAIVGFVVTKFLTRKM
jgi:hypothetical protein